MKKGVIKFFNLKAKFGFITCQDGKEYYVHIKDVLAPIKTGDEVTYVRTKHLLSPITTGDEVTFEPVPSKRGEQAVKVKKIAFISAIAGSVW